MFGLILKQRVQIGKIWFMQVQRIYRTKFMILISGEEVSLLLLGEIHVFPQKQYLALEFIFLVIFVFLFASLNLCIVATVLLV